MNKREEKINMLPDNVFVDSFKEHLETEGNERILFSGKFGIGKTFFLKDFFEKNKTKYEVFHLFPVNYQISSSKDIFDIIKYDILVELLNENKERKIDLFEKNDVGIFRYIKQNFSLNSALKKSISYLEVIELGKILGRPLKDMLELDKKYNEHINSEEEFVKNFISKIEKESITEIDYLSYILNNAIKKLRGENRESVLVLDDLDRLDPEHIFRVLNVFSAFFDRGGSNKFGFDKIILVADYDNLKSIFRHRYGEKTCEKGYFNKFYSINVFDFDNSKVVKLFLSNFFKEIKTDNEELKKSLVGRSYYIKIFLEDILIRSLDLKKLDLRQLMKIDKHKLPVFNEYNLNTNSRNNGMPETIKMGIELLKIIFGDEVLFKEVIKEIKENLNGTKQDLIQNNPERTYLTFSTQILRSLEGDIHAYINKYRNADIPFQDFSIKDPLTRGGEQSDIISLNSHFDAWEVKLFYSLLYEKVDKNEI